MSISIKYSPLAKVFFGLPKELQETILSFLDIEDFEIETKTTILKYDFHGRSYKAAIEYSILRLSLHSFKYWSYDPFDKNYYRVHTGKRSYISVNEVKPLKEENPSQKTGETISPEKFPLREELSEDFDEPVFKRLQHRRKHGKNLWKSKEIRKTKQRNQSRHSRSYSFTEDKMEDWREEDVTIPIRANPIGRAYYDDDHHIDRCLSGYCSWRCGCDRSFLFTVCF